MGTPTLSTSLWSNVAAVIATPVVVWLVSAGYGLLIERLARTRMPNALIVAVGFCAAVVVSLGTYETGAGDGIAIPVVIAPAVLGLVLCGRALPARLNSGWALVAAVVAYVLFDLSVIASGRWTLAFYNVENDSAYELTLVAHLQAHGTQAVSGLPSTAKSTLDAYLSTGYPLGGQSLLAIVSGLLRVPGAVVWQGFISAAAAVGVLAASALSGRLMGPRAAAGAALVALAAALTYEFALQGAIKEITTLVAVLTALAAMRHGVLKRDGAMLAVSAVALAAILAAFNAAGIPYVGALIASGALAWIVLDRPRPQRSWWRPALTGVAVLAVLSVPALITLGTFLNVAVTGFSGSHPTAPSLGPLIAPLPLHEISGVWLYGDYRLAPGPGLAGKLTTALPFVVAVLVLVGLGRAVRAREPGPLMGLGTTLLVLLIVYPRITPYAQAKLLAIGSPIIVLAALAGLSAPRRVLARAGAAVLALGLAAAVLGSDALAYRAAPTMPTPRMLALEQVGHYLGHRGPVLDSEFEQFAKVFAFPTPLIDGPDSPTPVALALTKPAPQYTHSFDLNQEQLPFVESFPYVLTRRSPLTSRPPANYRLVLENADYDLWRRMAGPRVLSHLPVGGTGVAADAQPSCPALRAAVRGAPRGSRLAISTLPAVSGYTLAEAAQRSRLWGPNGGFGGGFIAPTPGRAASMVTVPRSGRYEIWLQGNLPRPMVVALDGHTIGTAQSTNAPGGWLRAGSVQVAAGRHELAVVRNGVELGPGAGAYNETLNAVALAPPGSSAALSLVPLRRWSAVCRRPASWIEIVGR